MPGKGPSLEWEGEEGPERKEPKATSWLFPLLLLSSGFFQGSERFLKWRRAFMASFSEAVMLYLRQKQTIESLRRQRVEQLQNFRRTRSLSPQKQLSFLPKRDLPTRDFDLPSRRREYLQQLRKDIVETTRYRWTQNPAGSGFCMGCEGCGEQGLSLSVLEAGGCSFLSGAIPAVGLLYLWTHGGGCGSKGNKGCEEAGGGGTKEGWAKRSPGRG